MSKHRVTAIYPSKDGARFDFEYYRDHHVALVRELLGDTLTGVELYRGLPGPDGSRCPYTAVCHFYIGDMAAFRAAMREHQGRLLADIPSFTDLRPALIVEESFAD